MLGEGTRGGNEGCAAFCCGAMQVVPAIPVYLERRMRCSPSASQDGWWLAPLPRGRFRAGCWGALQVLQRLPRPCFLLPFSQAARQVTSLASYGFEACSKVNTNGDWGVGVASCSPSRERAKCFEGSGECGV